ncbi:MAG: S8 family serine peptidase [Nitrospinales bacterium]
MPKKPLLIFPKPRLAERKKRRGGGGGGEHHFPSVSQQVGRVEPKLTALRKAFEAEQAELTEHPVGMDPEQVLVLETAGSIENFLRAVKNVPKLEWLADVETDEIDPDEYFYKINKKEKKQPDKKIKRQLFLAMANQRAMDELLSLWERFKKGKPLGRGRKTWEDIFTQLYDLRRWDVEDRLQETGLLEDWKERLDAEEENLPLEIELWFRSDIEKRKQAQSVTEALLLESGGSIIASKIIEDINYHAILAEVPSGSAQTIIQTSNARLVKCQQVMFFRAVGQCKVSPPEDEPEEQKESCSIESDSMEKPTGDPVVALLDGMPLVNHQLLGGRLKIDDPDDWASTYQANEFNHGTTMASLIVHGELDEKERPLSRRIYVRPVMKPNPSDFHPPREESIPQDVLLVDLIYRAVKRIFEGEEKDQPATAPSVRVINLSLGDPSRPFNRFLSPWARLIDWISWKYKVLVCVSAGNQAQPIELGISANDFEKLPDDEKETEILKAVSADVRNRRILSPAESINCVTVGAAHCDGSSPNGFGMRVEFPHSNDMPSLINGLGLGFRRSIKPDILMPGGRQLFNSSHASNARFTPANSNRSPGQKVAAPGKIPGDLSFVHYTRGTSNANALASRGSAHCFEVLDEIRKNEPDKIPEDCIAPLLKAMVVHGALWGEAYNVLTKSLKNPSNSGFFKDIASRHLGYGIADINRVKQCTEERATLLGFGQLRNEEAHEFTLPLPPSLSGTTEWRQLVITLGWLSPLNQNHGKYRQAALWFEPPTEELNTDRKYAGWRTVRRGTVQHEVLAGKKASVFSDGDSIVIKVNCREDAGKLKDTLIPYGLLVTLEVDERIGIPIYQEIRDRIIVPVRIPAK